MTEPTPSAEQQDVIYVQMPKQPWYKRLGCMIPLGVTLAVLLFMGGCTALFGKATDEAFKELDEEYEVTYLVEGTFTKATAMYHLNSADNAHETDIQPGWSKTVKVSGLSGPYLDATESDWTSGAGGEITCKVIVNGKPISTITASGSSASAMCNPSIEDVKNAFK